MSLPAPGQARARRTGAAPSVDLNADCGESFGAWRLGDDAALFEVVTSANIACGFHAGDPDTMAATMAAALARGVALGAHPGYDDKAGFGRRVLAMTPAGITRMVAYQVGAAMALAALCGGRIGHVKPHGALSNVAAAEADVAAAVAAAVRAVDPGLTLLAPALSVLERAGHDAGLTVAAEVFADRAYAADGQLLPRSLPGAVLHDPAAAAAHALAMIAAGGIMTADGEHLPTPIASVCVHGDSPEAVATARAVRAALEAAGVVVQRFAP